jgi:simple sugar transport system ATP-binding protein
VEGSGQRELLRVLAGRCVPTSGTVRLPSATAFIPEDRLRDAIIGEMSLVENWALRGLGSRRGLLNWKQEALLAARGLADFDVRSDGVQGPTGLLSGGNQQKLVVARELSSLPSLIVAENPTRGLDVRASADVLRRLSGAREAGAAVVIYSSDVEELLGQADRVLVCFAGSVREVTCDFDAIGSAMLGAAG